MTYNDAKMISMNADSMGYSKISAFDYRVRVNRRARHVRITVNHHGEVVVVLPRPLPEWTIQELLQQNHEWIGARLQAWQEELANMPAAQGLQPDIIRLHAVGQHWPIEYGADLGRGHWREAQTPQRLQLRAAAHENTAREVLRSWLQQRARLILPPWLDQWAQQLGLSVGGVSIRAQKTRWGSCSSTGRINLNRNLLFLPAKLVDYLLIHELCHLREPNHSPRYWQLVEKVLPDYRSRDRALRDAVDEIPLWARPEGR